ncbi:hypothetical protein AB0C34_18105 [Nocardia sp. NPDC049220]|uniref:hypothetical protein n=1 Tax=Nocardia sp. NPDC049220 TaxID=3155273 RepID=UPI0033F78969
MSRWKLLAPLAAAAVLFGGVLLVRYATSSLDSTSDGTDSHSHIDPLDPHDSPPEVVACNAISIMLSWQPGPDTSSWEALHRAAPLLTGQLAATASSPPTPLPRQVPQWSSWAAARDTVSTAVSVLGKPTIRGDTATVTVSATQTVLHPGGQITPHRRSVLTVTLAHAENTWRVIRYTEEVR